MKKIVFFIQNFSRPGGSERVVSVIANQLCDFGYDIRIVSICGDNTCFYGLNENIKLNTLIKRPEVNNKIYFFKIICEYYKYLKNNKPDICIDVFASLSIYTILLKNIVQIKNITWEHFNYTANIGMNRIGRKFAVRFSDKIITLTNTDKYFYMNDNKNEFNIDYIFNPTPYRNECFSFSDKEKYVLSIGRLTYQKGYDNLIKIWSLIEKDSKFSDWKLLIIGDGEEKQNLNCLIKSLNTENVELKGSLSDVEDYYKKSSFFVSTSRFEGLPMTMIEAQTFGLPIISFDYNTGPKDIITNGVDGYIIENNSFEDMIAKMKLLMSDNKLCEFLGRNAFENSKRFDVNRIIEKWKNVIDNL